MALEIEHKYLVKDDSYKIMAEDCVKIRQGYLCKEPLRTVRVRTWNDKGFLTIKGLTHGDVRDEFEYEIRNKIHDKNISASQIQKKGFTTKKNHQGLGLTNIRNIENRYPNMTISHTVEDGWFDFYMMIDAEDGE